MYQQTVKESFRIADNLANLDKYPICSRRVAKLYFFKWKNLGWALKVMRGSLSRDLNITTSCYTYPGYL